MPIVVKILLCFLLYSSTFFLLIKLKQQIGFRALIFKGELRETVMEGDTSYVAGPPPIFDGEDYELWAARITTHLAALDLWEAVE